MSSAAAIRRQIESALASRIPSALTPAPRSIRPAFATGVSEIDAALQGGLPMGAITEMTGPECSGRTSVALSVAARLTQAGKVCAWVDASDMLHPESAAAAGIDLSRLLWVRCGVLKGVAAQKPAARDFALPEKYLVGPPAPKGLHGGGFGPHPRNEARGLSDAVNDLLRPESNALKSTGPQLRSQAGKEGFTPKPQHPEGPGRKVFAQGKPWPRIEQALRVTDLILQAGGFGALVLDMGGIAPEYVSRVPMATWFRYRAAAERTQTGILLLTQSSCAKSSGELLLRFCPGNMREDETTVFAGIEHRLEIARRRFAQESPNVAPIRKPPQSANRASWRSRSAWMGPR